MPKNDERMSPENVKVTILGKDYVIKTSESKKVEAAEKAIGVVLQQMREKYGITDRTELLSMALIKMATDVEYDRGIYGATVDFAEKVNNELRAKLSVYLDNNLTVL